MKPIAIPEGDTAEQEELRPKSLERTTTANNTEEVTNRTEPQPTESPQTQQLATVERNEPVDLGPPTQGEVDAMENPTEQVQDMQPRNDVPTGTTPSPDRYVGVEPNIRDILEEE